ncbi:unnamed protein product [Brassica rapa subsp. trilocularis]
MVSSSAVPSLLSVVACVLLFLSPASASESDHKATVYHLWKQRNNSLHNGVCLPPQTVVRLIDREVRNVIT